MAVAVSAQRVSLVLSTKCFPSPHQQRGYFKWMSWEYDTNTVRTHLLCVAEFHEMKTFHIVLFGPECRLLTCLPHYLCSRWSLQAVVRPSRSLSSAHLIPSCNSVQAFIISNIVLMKGHGKVNKHKSYIRELVQSQSWEKCLFTQILYANCISHTFFCNQSILIFYFQKVLKLFPSLSLPKHNSE